LSYLKASGLPIVGNFATAGANSNISELTGLTTPLSVAQGGTGTSTGVPVASETAAGLIEIATSAEAAGGTDTTRAITPAGLRSGLNASGTAPVYACRAWVNFNGTGTVAIRASGNVSSITDNGTTGDYTVNFTNAMQDGNYSVAATTGDAADVNQTNRAVVSRQHLTSSVRLMTFVCTTGAAADMPSVTVAIFR
jgi:hypothetical protein